MAPSIAAVPGMKDRTIVVESLSKTYAMTGWRIGYLLAPEAVIEQTGKIAELMHSSVNSLAQYAGVAALAGPQDHVAAMREEYRAKRQIVLDGLAGCPVLRLIEPQGAFYAFVDVRLTGLDSGEFADRLLDEEHVAVVPGEAFGEEGAASCASPTPEMPASCVRASPVCAHLPNGYGTPSPDTTPPLITPWRCWPEA